MSKFVTTDNKIVGVSLLSEVNFISAANLKAIAGSALQSAATGFLIQSGFKLLSYMAGIPSEMQAVENKLDRIDERLADIEKELERLHATLQEIKDAGLRTKITAYVTAADKVDHEIDALLRARQANSPTLPHLCFNYLEVGGKSTGRWLDQLTRLSTALTGGFDSHEQHKEFAHFDGSALHAYSDWLIDQAVPVRTYVRAIEVLLSHYARRVDGIGEACAGAIDCAAKAGSIIPARAEVLFADVAGTCSAALRSVGHYGRSLHPSAFELYAALWLRRESFSAHISRANGAGMLVRVLPSLDDPRLKPPYVFVGAPSAPRDWTSEWQVIPDGDSEKIWLRLDAAGAKPLRVGVEGRIEFQGVKGGDPWSESRYNEDERTLDGGEKEMSRMRGDAKAVAGLDEGSTKHLVTPRMAAAPYFFLATENQNALEYGSKSGAAFADNKVSRDARDMWWCFIPPLRTSAVVGGDGGGAFDDMAFKGGDGIAGIGGVAIWTRLRVVSGLRFTYRLAHGGTVDGPTHGDCSGDAVATISFKEAKPATDRSEAVPREDLIEVRGRSGRHVDEISFVTTQAEYGPYGGSGGGTFSLKGAFLAAFGHAGSFIDSLGFWWNERAPPGSCPLAEPEARRSTISPPTRPSWASRRSKSGRTTRPVARTTG